LDGIADFAFAVFIEKSLLLLIGLGVEMIRRIEAKRGPIKIDEDMTP
jgi:hypothetical protein